MLDDDVPEAVDPLVPVVDPVADPGVPVVEPLIEPVEPLDVLAPAAAAAVPPADA